MPAAICDGIRTHYEVLGEGPPLLMLSPGGFNATIDNWRSFGVYQRLKLLDHLPARFTCITFDRREAGESGGRVEPITWASYVAQASALLDELGIERAHVIGGCIGCTIAFTFAEQHPERTQSVVLYSPAGGGTYRRKQHTRFADHLAYVDEHGLAGVVALAQSVDASFSQDPRVGLWASMLRTDHDFAASYAEIDPGEYRALVDEIARTLFDRDDVPGADPDELRRVNVPALVVPGDDENHARAAALHLEEHLPRAEIWDVPPAEQTEGNAPRRLLEFLARSRRASDRGRESGRL